MKRVFLGLCLIPALLLCSCAPVPAVESQGEANQTTKPEDMEQKLCDIATEVALAYGSGKFEDVEQYMLYSFDEQVDMLFKDQTAPYQYEDHTFESKDAIKEAVRSQLISGENSDFTITVTGTELVLYTYEGDKLSCEVFGYDVPEPDYTGWYIEGAELAGTVTVSVSLANGEETTGEMAVHFLKVNGQWKVYSPTVMGFFLRLYKPVSAAPAN